MDKERVLRTIQPDAFARINLIGGVIGDSQAYQTETESHGKKMRSQEFTDRESALEDYVAILEQTLNSNKRYLLTPDEADFVARSLLYIYSLSGSRRVWNMAHEKQGKIIIEKLGGVKA